MAHSATSLWLQSARHCPKSQRNNVKKLRQSLDCDGEGETDEDDEDASSLFFREVEVTTFEELKTVYNADQESESDE